MCVMYPLEDNCTSNSVMFKKRVRRFHLCRGEVFLSSLLCGGSHSFKYLCVTVDFTTFVDILLVLIAIKIYSQYLVVQLPEYFKWKSCTKENLRKMPKRPMFNLDVWWLPVQAEC